MSNPNPSSSQSSPASMATSDRQALALMGCTILLWSFSWVVMKTLTAYIGAVDMVAWRYVIALVFLAALQAYRRQSFAMPALGLCVGIAIFQTVGFQTLTQLALMTGGAGHVVLLAYTMPFWAVLFSWWLLKQRPSAKHWLALALGLAGLLLVLQPWQGLGNLGSSLLALAAGCCWGLGAVLAKIMFVRHQPSILNLTVWQLFLGAVITLPLSWLVPQQPIQFGPTLYFGMAYMGLLASGLGWLMWLGVIQRVSTAVASMSSLGVPVLAMLLAWLLLNEQPSRLDLLGVACVLSGLIVVNWPNRRAALRV